MATFLPLLQSQPRSAKGRLGGNAQNYATLPAIISSSSGFDEAPPFDEASPLWARARFFAAQQQPLCKGPRRRAAAAAASAAAAAAAESAAERSAEEVIVPQYDAEHPLGVPSLVNVLAYVALAGFASEAATAAGTCKALWLRDVQLRWALVSAKHGARKMTRLHRACAKGSVSRAGELLDQGSELTACDARGWTPLHFASAFGHAELVTALRVRSARTDACASDGSVPLHLAGSLAERRPALSTQPLSLPAPAPWTRHRDGDEKWYVNQASGEVAFELPLGAEAADAAPVRGAAGAGGSLHSDASDDDAVSGAVVRALLAPMAHDKAPFAAAAMRDDAGATPLFAAASAGRLAHVRTLLTTSLRVQVDARDASGATPLLAAAKMGHADVLSELLKRGADANAGGSTGETALHKAASRSGSAHTCMMKSLLAHGGVLVDARTQSGDTPLMLAAARCDFQQIQLLLSHGASRQARNSNLRRALDLAVRAPRRGSIGLIYRLLS